MLLKTKEQELINRCLANNKAAQKELVESYGPAMYANIIRYVGKTDEAEDILQEVFISVFKALPNFQHNSTLGHWIKTITMNSIFKSAKSHWKQKVDIVETVEYDNIFDQNDAIEKMKEEDIISAVNELPEINRVVFMMYAVEGYSHEEIGQILEISEEGSRSRLFKARKLLREILSCVKSFIL